MTHVTHTTMHAIRVHQFGGPEVLRYEQLPRPEPGPCEVLIRVHAAGMNPPDRYLREGFVNYPNSLRPTGLALPFTPGWDLSGVVAAVGDGVSEFREGDAVCGLVRFPVLLDNGEYAPSLNNGGRTYAEYTTSPVSQLAHKPTSIDHVHAAGVPMAGLTAYQYLAEHIQLQAGMTVLINGAAGGVGHFLLQLAKIKGAHVIGVASTRHEAFLADLGADQFLDYTTTPLHTLGRVADIVLDTVGGPHGYRLLDVLKRGGTLAPVFFGDYHLEQAADLEISHTMGQVHFDATQMTELAHLIDSGRLRVGIDAIFPLAKASDAHQRADQGHAQGKTILQVV